MLPNYQARSPFVLKYTTSYILYIYMAKFKKVNDACANSQRLLKNVNISVGARNLGENNSKCQENKKIGKS